MIELLRRYARFVVGHAWLVVASSVIATAALALGAARLVVDLDPEKQLPASDPYVTIDRQIQREFGGRNFVAIAVVPDSGVVWTPPVLQTVYDLTVDVLNAPGVIRQSVASLSSPYVRVPRDRGGVLTADYLMRGVPGDAAGIAALGETYEKEPLFRGTVVLTVAAGHSGPDAQTLLRGVHGRGGGYEPMSVLVRTRISAHPSSGSGSGVRCHELRSRWPETDAAQGLLVADLPSSDPRRRLANGSRNRRRRASNSLAASP